ncbi:MAG: TIM-barrel domain-containing protein [Lactobacillus sp.]
MTQETQMGKHQLGSLTGANKCKHYYELHYRTGEVARLYILADGIFRYYLDPTGQFPAETTTTDPLMADTDLFEASQAKATSEALIIKSGHYQLIFQQKTALLSIFDEQLHRTRFAQASPLELGAGQSCEFIKQAPNEFYYGAGFQNGHFSHKGQKVIIKRDRLTGEDGVITQVPFFWSNAGFAELRRTNAPGCYDFGKTNPAVSALMHQSASFDNYYLLADSPQALLGKYYHLTGKPCRLPTSCLQLGHIGNFLTTLWRPALAKERQADLFEDGHYYLRTSNPNQAAGKASLNGEETFQFSARAMIDRYLRHGFPLGWLIPNYGQAPVDPQSLATLTDYAETHELGLGLWSAASPQALAAGIHFVLTSSPTSATVKQINSTLAANQISARQFMLSDQGFVGNQNQLVLLVNAAGGDWHNIPVQVAGILGSGLSGQPLVGMAVDGGAGGGNAQMAIRDFEWKALSPILCFINDQGRYSKTPFAYNAKMTEINRAYLALRTKLGAYLYTLMHATQAGQPVMRPIFWEFPHEQLNYTTQVGAEYLLGPNLLVAPIYSGREDANGHSKKDKLYLPDHRTLWIDLFTGEPLVGGRVYNNRSYPLWHLPVFVRGGAIFDLGERQYVIYPQGQSHYDSYEDDDRRAHHYASTHLSSSLDDSTLTVKITPTTGSYPGMVTQAGTTLNLLTDHYPDGIQLKINDRIIKLQEYGTVETFAHAKEGFFYNTHYSWLPEFDGYQPPRQQALQIKLTPRDITQTTLELTIRNFNYGGNRIAHAITDALLRSPKQPTILGEKTSAHSITVSWPAITNEVQIEVNGILHVGLQGNHFTFHELAPHTRYLFRLRYLAGNKVSEWSDPFGAVTKPRQLDYAMRHLQVDSNLPSAPDHPLAYLTDLKLASEWQTATGVSETAPLVLTFTFEQVEELSRIVFVPRAIDSTGDPLSVQLASSPDGTHFTPYGDRITWKADNKNKVIGLRDVTAKAIRLTVFKAVGNCVSGQELMIFKAQH